MTTSRSGGTDTPPPAVTRGRLARVAPDQLEVLGRQHGPDGAGSRPQRDPQCARPRRRLLDDDHDGRGSSTARDLLDQILTTRHHQQQVAHPALVDVVVLRLHLDDPNPVRARETCRRGRSGP